MALPPCSCLSQRPIPPVDVLYTPPSDRHPPPFFDYDNGVASVVVGTVICLMKICTDPCLLNIVLYWCMLYSIVECCFLLLYCIGLVINVVFMDATNFPARDQ